jgi:iron complex transport system substrate-binding protein
MNGHHRPRRAAARSLFLFAVLLAVLLVLAVGTSAVIAGCGSATDGQTTSTASVTVPSSETTLAPSTTESSSTTLAEGTFPVTVTDDNKNSVTVKAKPVRIVSTAPASTETLFALGVGDKVVGVTSLDDYPPEVAKITKIGDFQANTEAIMALSPDLVVGYSGNEEALKPVQAAGAPVLIFNPSTVDGVYSNITTLGAATGTAAKAAELVESIKAQIKAASDAAATATDKPRVFYALDNTLWTAGPKSFVDELLGLANCTNVGSAEMPAGVASQPYYQLTPEQLVAVDPDLILLPSSSGYKSADEFTKDSRFAGLKAVKAGHVYLFDDTTLTRPGPRLGEGFKLLVETIHPGVLK